MIAPADNQAPGLENCVTLDADGDGAADPSEPRSCAQVKLLALEGDEAPERPDPELTVTKRAINTTCKPGITCWFQIIVSNSGRDDFTGKLDCATF